MPLQLSTNLRARLIGPEAFDAIFNNGVIRIFSGSQPVDADAAATGTLLASVTVSGGAFAHGSADNGLKFTRSGIYVMKQASQTWRITPVANGVASWFRLCANPVDNLDLSYAHPRLDGKIGLAGDTQAQMILANLSLTIGVSHDMQGFWYAIPPIPEA